MKHSTSLFSIFVVLALLLVACGGDSETTTTTTTTIPTGEAHPLFDMLKRTPTQFIETYMSYTDFRAVEDALPYVERPESGQLFYDNWTGYSERWYMFADFKQNLTRGVDSHLTTMGFEFRDVNRIFAYGRPPENGVIWSGDFDEQAIRDAHTARGYSATTINDIEAWCYEGDCTTGTRTNPVEPDMGNLFDNRLGRKVPFLIWDDTLISAPSATTFEQTAQLPDGSLYDNADIRALAQAATAPQGLLVNWMLLPVTEVSLPFITEQIEGITDNYQTLPPYNAVAIADRQERDRMVALVMLTYNDEATAQIAAEELSARMSNFSARNWLPPISESVPGALITHSTYTSDTGRVVAIVRIEYDTPTAEQAIASPSSRETYLPDAEVFRIMYDNINSRSLYPLGLGWND